MPAGPPVPTGSREPAYSRFTQQELPACKPLLTPRRVISIFLSIAVVFIPIGAACLAGSAAVVEVSARYDDSCVAGSNNRDRESTLLQTGGNGTTCTVTLNVPRRMRAPVFVYYQLNNFYQNHRRYVKSRSDPQLQGQIATLSSLKNCEPELYQGSHNESLRIDPCGLIAWSFFNDTYQLAIPGGSGAQLQLPVDESGIAWSSDIKKKFGSQLPSNFNSEEFASNRGGATINGPVREDEHFIVWMRTAALPNFRKLWGRVDQDLPANTQVTVSIQNRYNTYRFDGEKMVVLSTTSWLGGKNNFLGIAYLVTGSVSLLFGLTFFGVQWRHPRKLGDTSYLSWNSRMLVDN